MLVGYARTSTDQQKAGFEAQLRDLKAAGCERIFSEEVSSVAERAQLLAALEFVREGDAFMVTKLDRLARSTKHLWEIVEELERKHVALRIMNLGVDTGTPTGRLMLTLIGAIAQFERELLLERQLEGIAAAKLAGKYRGRKPTAMAKADQIQALVSGGMSKSAAARRCGVSRSSVYRAL